MTVREDRIACCIPHCRRTADAAKFKCQEIVCGKHWRMAPVKDRRDHNKLAREYRRRFGDNGWWDYPAGSPDRLAAVRLATECDELWERCKAKATEAAGGLR